MKKTTFWKLLSKDGRQIVIPVNQREYAQGRHNSRSDDVRAVFVNAIYEALTGDKPLSLDLIYGSLEDGRLVPYDGQQRLTTLFLLHWLMALRSGNLDADVCEVLGNFRYDLREETEKFCQQLLVGSAAKAIAGASDRELRTVISDQPWYDAKWDRDPGISGMLTMLQALDDRFTGAAYADAWKKLTSQDAITFLYEEIGKLGATGEELYITMNSRGKELGRFEKFKPKFLELIKKEYSAEEAATFARKLDGEWLDFFWTNFGRNAPDAAKGERTDEVFYNFLWFIFDMLRFLPLENEEITPLPEAEPVAALYQRAEAALNPKREEFWPGHSNLSFLGTVLDKLNGYTGTCGQLFNEYFYAAGDSGMPVQGKISWFEASADLLASVCAGDRKEATHLRRYMLLGFLLWYASGQTSKWRLRHLRNLVCNSSNELGRPEEIARQLSGMAVLLLNGMGVLAKEDIPRETWLQSRFNGRQLEEEIAKRELALKDSEAGRQITWLEDHPFLRGNLSVAYAPTGSAPAFNPDVIERIHNLFVQGLGRDSIKWSEWLAALLATGAFDWWTEQDFVWWWKPSLRLYNGSTVARREIFIGQEPADRLPWSQKSIQKIADWGRKSSTREDLAGAMHKQCERWLQEKENDRAMDWTWYFVRYPEMLPDNCETNGYYYWGKNHWSFLQRQLSKTYASSTNWNPFLWAVWVKAALEDREENGNGLSWEEEPGAVSRNYILFPCGFTLWPAEFGWLILTREGRRPYSQAFQVLRATYGQLNENGYFYIPGLNRLAGEERQKMDADWKAALDSSSDYERENWRICDFQNRIAIGAELAQAILEL